MQQLRTLHVLYLTENAHKLSDIIAVEGTEVPDVHSLENVLLMADGTLQGIVQPDDTFSALVRKHTLVVQPPASLEPQPVVSLVSVEVQQILLHTTHGMVDGHIIVIENDKQVVRVARNIVQTLVSQSAAHGAIADDSHHMAVLVLQLCSHCHTQRSRNGVRRMPAGERIVVALQWGRERTEPAQLPVFRELVAASCQNLVPVGLMSDIPDEAVLRSVEHIMAGDGYLNSTQARSKVPRVNAQLIDNIFP